MKFKLTRWGILSLIAIGAVLLLTSRSPAKPFTLPYWPGMVAQHAVPVRWEPIALGFEKTHLEFEGETKSCENDYLVLPRKIEMVVFRVDPSRYPVRVITASGLYGARKAHLKKVHKKMHAILTVNGGYFDHDGYAEGLVISDGHKRSDWSEDGGSGAFAVFDGVPRIDWAIKVAETEPGPMQALQNGPLLIEPGGVFGMQNRRDKYFPRTVIGLDESGRVLIGVTRKTFSETDLRSGLNLFETALIFYNRPQDGGFGARTLLNLDGGTSTGMRFTLGAHEDEVKVGIRLPNFICVMPPKPDDQ